MSRIIAMIVSTVVIIGFCICSSMVIQNNQSEITALLEEAVMEAEADHVEEAYALSIEIEKKWIEAEKTLSIFVNHAEINTVGISISKLTPLIKHRDIAAFTSECRTSVVYLSHISNAETPTLHNLL